METIAVINQKGGCGKTTVSLNLASALARTGKKTLLVDMDPQSHCAVGLAVPDEQIEQSIYDVLISRTRELPIPLAEILWEIDEGFNLAPASLDLVAFEQQMAGVPNRENCLKDVLDEISDQYDYTIIDCPPAVGLLTFNALRAAGNVIVPVETGYFSLHGLSKQLETITVLSQQCRQNINVKVLASLYDIRTKISREILGEIRKLFGKKMFRSVINFNTKLKEAASLGQPICEYDPTSKGYKDFQALADEIVGSSVTEHKHEPVDSPSEQLDSVSDSAKDYAHKSVDMLQEQFDSIISAKDHTQKPVASLQDQLDSISTSADELLKTIKPPIEQDKIKVVNLDEKLADFYGVRQVDDAMMFLTLYPRAQTVCVAGDFNNWQPQETPMKKIGGNGLWELQLPLAPGKYRYRMVVDGKWQPDPHNGHTELNPFGEQNSVFEVK